MIKIMLVDNDPVYTSLMAEVLRLHSFNTVTATDGVAALETLQHDHIDLVISDISMPKMNGMNLYKHIRSNQKFKNLMFVWNSGYRELRDVVDVENPAMDFKLDKAIPMPSFLYFINSLQQRIERQKEVMRN